MTIPPLQGRAKLGNNRGGVTPVQDMALRANDPTVPFPEGER
jgi:hypothetical protein